MFSLVCPQKKSERFSELNSVTTMSVLFQTVNHCSDWGLYPTRAKPFIRVAMSASICISSGANLNPGCKDLEEDRGGKLSSTEERGGRKE